MSLSNLSDVAQGVANGQIGIIDVIKIGEVTVSALTGLSGGDSVEISDRAVQAGFLVTEGVIKNPRERVLTIVLADPEISLEAGLSAAISGDLAGFTETWRDKKAALYAHFNALDIIDVVTHEDVYPSMIIRSITPLFDADENWDCFVAQVEVREWSERSTTSATGVDNALTAAAEALGAL